MQIITYKKFKLLITYVTLLFLTAACTHQDSEVSKDFVNGADDVKISYKTYGTSETAVIFVHGWSCDQTYWREQIAAFEQDYQVVTLDLGGHGLSPASREDWSIKSFGEDVAAVANAIDAKQIVLVGHSMGGPVVIEAAKNIGNRLVKIIGVDTLKRAGSGPMTREAALKLHSTPFEVGFATRIEKMVRNSMFSASASEQLIDEVSKDMGAGDPFVALDASVGMLSYDIPQALKELEAYPIVLINGDGTKTDQAALYSAHQNSRVTIIPDTGHFVMLERPEIFNTQLRKELEPFLTDK